MIRGLHPLEGSFVKQVCAKTRIDGKLVQQALQLIKHSITQGGNRDTREPYYSHPIAVAQILLSYTQDQDTILAALLHDTIDATRLSLQSDRLYTSIRLYSGLWTAALAVISLPYTSL